MDTNVLFGTIVVYQVNNTHLKKLSQSIFIQWYLKIMKGPLWFAESIIYIFKTHSKIHFLFYVNVSLKYLN